MNADELVTQLRTLRRRMIEETGADPVLLSGQFEDLEQGILELGAELRRLRELVE